MSESFAMHATVVERETTVFDDAPDLETVIQRAYGEMKNGLFTMGHTGGWWLLVIGDKRVAVAGVDVVIDNHGFEFLQRVVGDLAETAIQGARYAILYGSCALAEKNEKTPTPEKANGWWEALVVHAEERGGDCHRRSAEIVRDESKNIVRLVERDAESGSVQKDGFEPDFWLFRREEENGHDESAVD